MSTLTATASDYQDKLFFRIEAELSSCCAFVDELTTLHAYTGSVMCFLAQFHWTIGLFQILRKWCQQPDRAVVSRHVAGVRPLTMLQDRDMRDGAEASQLP